MGRVAEWVTLTVNLTLLLESGGNAGNKDLRAMVAEEMDVILRQAVESQDSDRGDGSFIQTVTQEQLVSETLRWVSDRRSKWGGAAIA